MPDSDFLKNVTMIFKMFVENFICEWKKNNTLKIQ